MTLPAAVPESVGPADAGVPVRVPELVPQPHGGAIYRGGMPGNAGASVASIPQLKRRAARHLAELEQRAYEVAEKALTGAEAEADPDKALEKLRGVTELMQHIGRIAGAAERTAGPNELGPLEITVRTRHPAPQAKSESRVPSADPNQVAAGSSEPQAEEGAPPREVEGGK